jgi:regulatory protein
MNRQTTDSAHRPDGRRRPPRPLTRARLERIALHHLERYPSSTARLREVLERRAARSRELHAGDAAEHTEWIDAVVARLTDLGWLDDRAYARAVARRLRARGASRRLVESRLAQRGVAEDDRRAALEAEDAPAAERAAAATFARRRRLGAHRSDPEERSARRERDLAALARAGFSYEIACEALDTDPDPA